MYCLVTSRVRRREKTCRVDEIVYSDWMGTVIGRDRYAFVSSVSLAPVATGAVIGVCISPYLTAPPPVSLLVTNESIHPLPCQSPPSARANLFNAPPAESLLATAEYSIAAATHPRSACVPWNHGTNGSHRKRKRRSCVCWPMPYILIPQHKLPGIAPPRTTRFPAWTKQRLVPLVSRHSCGI